MSNVKERILGAVTIMSEKDAERLENFLEKLDDLDDVSDVYHNWDEE